MHQTAGGLVHSLDAAVPRNGERHSLRMYDAAHVDNILSCMHHDAVYENDPSECHDYAGWLKWRARSPDGKRGMLGQQFYYAHYLSPFFCFNEILACEKACSVNSSSSPSFCVVGTIVYIRPPSSFSTFVTSKLFNQCGVLSISLLTVLSNTKKPV